MAKAPLNISKRRPRSTRPLFVPDVNELKRRMGTQGSVVETAAPKIESAPLKLRFGTHEEEGFIKMVPAFSDEVVVNPPWKLPGSLGVIKDEKVEAIFFAFYYHRLTQRQRFVALDEAYRVLKPGGQIMIVSPYWSSRRAVADPLAVWPPVCEESFYVYSKVWRESDGLDKLLGLKCDFAAMTPQGQLVVPAGHIPDPEVAQRNDEYRQHASRHFVNAVWELHVTLTKVGEQP
jgi:hypothetical protein